MGSVPPDGNCLGSACGYGAFDGDVGCHTDDGSCWTARLVEAEESAFHDADLQQATAEITQILGKIKPKEGRKLSFVHTAEGTLLAWVRHGVKFPDHAVTFKDGHEKVKKALKLKEKKPKA